MVATTISKCRCYLFLGAVFICNLHNVMCLNFPVCQGQDLQNTTRCCTRDEASLLCVFGCPNGYYLARSSGCSNVDPVSDTGASSVLSSNLTVCCQCHEACLNCSAAGQANCHVCADAHDLVSGQCVATAKTTDTYFVQFLASTVVFSVVVLTFLIGCVVFWVKNKIFLQKLQSGVLGVFQLSPAGKPTPRIHRRLCSDPTMQGRVCEASFPDRFDLTRDKVHEKIPVRPRSEPLTRRTSEMHSVLINDASSSTRSSYTNGHCSRRTQPRRCSDSTLQGSLSGTSCSDLFELKNPSTGSDFSEAYSLTPSFSYSCSYPQYQSVSCHKALHVSSSSNTNDTQNSSLNVGKLEENQISALKNTLFGLDISVSTQTELDYIGQSEDNPMLADLWSAGDTFTSLGGVLRGKDSDVRLDIPAGAIEEGHDVIVKSAVCTNLEMAHRNLQLPECQHITTPVVEFSASGFQFERPVCIVLPHFLPRDFREENVKVYQCSVSVSGEWRLQSIPREEKDNVRLAASTAAQEGDAKFYFAENKEIRILTKHFTLYLCTYCATEFPLSDLYLEVLAKWLHRNDEEEKVEIRLYIWDSRFNIGDFRKGLRESATENYRGMDVIDTKVLEALTTTDLGRVHVQVKVFLDLKHPDTWMHALRGQGVVHKPERVMDLQKFVSCGCRRSQVPYRVDWEVVNRPGSRPTQPCDCYVDAHYLIDGQDVEVPEKVTIVASISKKSAEDQSANARKVLHYPVHRLYNNLSSSRGTFHTEPKQTMAQQDALCQDRDEELLGAVGGEPRNPPSVFRIDSVGNITIGGSSPVSPVDEASLHATRSLPGQHDTSRQSGDNESRHNPGAC